MNLGPGVLALAPALALALGRATRAPFGAGGGGARFIAVTALMRSPTQAGRSFSVTVVGVTGTSASETAGP